MEDRIPGLRPGERQALKGLAVATAALGDPSITLSVVEEAFLAGVSDISTRHIHASALCEMQCYDEAVRDATASLQVKPNEAIALNNRGYARLKLGELDNAIADLEAAVKSAPTLERPREVLAEARQAAQGLIKSGTE